MEKGALRPSGAATVSLHFRVQLPEEVLLQPDEFLSVTGSVPELGVWIPKAGTQLARSEHNPVEWSGVVEVSSSHEQILFRYYIASRLHGDNGDAVIVSRWESFLRPRSVLLRAETRNGECRVGHIDKFGYYAGSKKIQDGWLDDAAENQILLRIHGKALKFYKVSYRRDRFTVSLQPGLSGKPARIKMKPLDVRQWQQQGNIASPDDPEDWQEDGEETPIPGQEPSHSQTLVSNLASDRPGFRAQSDLGETFVNEKDYLVFRTHSVAVEFLAFHLEVLWADGRHVGQCYALPSSLFDTFGATSIPFINSQGRPIGQITVEYLFIRPLRCPAPPQTLAVSYAKHWKKRNTIEVGHRGMGNSYTKFAVARENTIHSLNAAAKNGADFVEFDVQLTKDKVAVIYHDFHVLISVARKKSSSIADLTALQNNGGARDVSPKALSATDASNVEFHEIAVKDLKLNQLKLLLLDHLKTSEMANVSKLTGDVEEADDLKPFPTLVEALNRVDPVVGFNIEVKYPMMQMDGLHECANYFERNLFVDVILSDVLLHAGNRRIMFSSFDPDICSLISMKQNMYPVLFLCVGETNRYVPFQDQRTTTSLTAVNFAAGADILGVDFNSEDLLKDPRPVHRARELGLISFVWGDDLNDKVHANYFKKELGVDGIIYDRIGEEERRQNVFMVEREQKRALFLASSGSSTPVRANSTESMNSLPGHTAVHTALTALEEAAPGDREASAADPSLSSLTIGEQISPSVTPPLESQNKSDLPETFADCPLHCVSNTYVSATQS